MSDFRIETSEEGGKRCNPCLVIEPEAFTKDAVKVQPELRIRYNNQNSAEPSSRMEVPSDQMIPLSVKTITFDELSKTTAHDFYSALQDPEKRKELESQLTKDVNGMLHGVSIDGLEFGAVKFPKYFLAQETELKQADNKLAQAQRNLAIATARMSQIVNPTSQPIQSSGKPDASAPEPEQAEPIPFIPF